MKIKWAARDDDPAEAVPVLSEDFGRIDDAVRSCVREVVAFIQASAPSTAHEH